MMIKNNLNLEDDYDEKKTLLLNVNSLTQPTTLLSTGQAGPLKRNNNACVNQKTSLFLKS